MTDYDITVRVGNAAAMSDDLFAALRNLAIVLADEQVEVEGHAVRAKSLDLGTVRKPTSGPIVRPEPESWCLGYSIGVGGTSCWIDA